MGHNSHASAFLIISLIMFATATPLAHAQGLLPGLGLPPLLSLPTGSIIQLPPVGSLLTALLNQISSFIRGVIVTGNICCTPTGNCTSGAPPLVGAVVNLNCPSLSGGSALLGQGTTNANGTFLIDVPSLSGLLPINSLIPACNISVQLPPNQTICIVLSTDEITLDGATGTLITVVRRVSLLVTGLLQFVLNLTLSQ